MRLEYFEQLHIFEYAPVVNKYISEHDGIAVEVDHLVLDQSV